MEQNGRRTFLGLCLGGMATLAAGAVMWPVYRYLSPRSGNDEGRKVVVAEQDIPEKGVHFFEYAGSAAVLVRTRGGGLIALSAVCSHLGCIIQWDKDKQSFICPCHGGQFSAEGVVIAGPPPRPLNRLPVSVANGSITIG